MATTTRAQRGRILIARSLRLLKNHKRLFVFPVLGYLCKLIIYVALITPFLHSREQIMQVNNLPASQVVLVIVVFMLLLFVVNLVLFFFNTAIIANLLYFLKDNKEASIKFGFKEALKNYGRVFLWALYAGTAGIVFNLLPRNSQYKLKLEKLLRKNHWHIASFLSLSLIIDKKLNPLAALRESSQLTDKVWGSNLRPNYSLVGLLFWLRVPILLIFIFSAMYATSHLTILTVGIIAGFLILLSSSFYQMINTCLRVVCYCYAKHNIAVEPFSANMIERLFVSRSLNAKVSTQRHKEVAKTTKKPREN
jgi:hypothetical protein